MPYYPTELDWTLILRLERILLNERFPSKFVVNSLQKAGSRHPGAAPHRVHELQAQSRQGQTRRGTNRHGNPNLIHIPKDREEGKLLSAEHEWTHKPMGTPTYMGNTDDPNPNIEGWS